ncbi:MAG: hypothetical protein H7A34_08625 [bacterium]|nr:hypothetical protein [bacterium]
MVHPYSYVNGERYQTIPDVQQYCSMLNTQKKEIHINHEKLPDEMSLRETAALAVRLIHEGIDIEELQKRYSTINVKKIIFPTIQKLIDENLLKEKESNVYVLTAEGIRFADYIAEELM